MTTSKTRKQNSLQYAATLLGAVALFALAPATAHATDNGPGPSGGGCHYTDKDGYDIPIDEGQSVIVDGKTVTCKGGQTTEPAGPKRGVGNVRGPIVSKNLPVFAVTP